MKKSHMEAKLTKSFKNFSKLKVKSQNFENELKNSSKKPKVSANPLGLWSTCRKSAEKKACFIDAAADIAIL